MLYKHSGQGHWMQIDPSVMGTGVFIKTSPTGYTLPDDEIPGLLSTLQDYMSRKAKEISKAAKR